MAKHHDYPRTNRRSATAMIWIGLTELAAFREGTPLDGCAGAYSHYLVHCVDEASFHDLAEVEADCLGLCLMNVEWCVPFRDLTDVESDLRALRDSLREGDGGCFGTFQAW